MRADCFYFKMDSIEKMHFRHSGTLSKPQNLGNEYKRGGDIRVRKQTTVIGWKKALTLVEPGVG